MITRPPVREQQCKYLPPTPKGCVHPLPDENKTAQSAGPYPLALSSSSVAQIPIARAAPPRQLYLPSPQNFQNCAVKQSAGPSPGAVSSSSVTQIPTARAAPPTGALSPRNFQKCAVQNASRDAPLTRFPLSLSRKSILRGCAPTRPTSITAL
jgi:hypothetical protein